jgi:hypothetical protein
MRVVYSKGADLECPDALSRLCYDVSSEAQHLCDWAARLGAEPEMEEFDVQECFAVTRLGTARAGKLREQQGDETVRSTATPALPTTNSPAASVAVTPKVEGMTVKLLPAYADKLRKATQNSRRIRAVYNTLKNEGTLDPHLDTITIPATCQYALRDDLLYLIDPRDRHLRLILSSQELRKKQLAIAHDETHCGFYRTFKRLSNIYWTSMAKDIAAYLAYCPACLVNKPARHKLYGQLSPIISLSKPFETITIDFVTDLPPCTR